MKKMRFSIALLILCIILAALIIGCEQAVHYNEPVGTIPINVGDGIRPVYSWPDGAVKAVRVYKFEWDGTDELVWGCASGGEDRIYPPVTHGITPEGAEPICEVELTLDPEGEYEVYIVNNSGEAGSKYFKPFD